MSKKALKAEKEKSKKKAIKDKSSKQTEGGIVFNITRPNLLFSFVLILGVLAILQTFFIVRLSNQVSAQEVKELATSSQSGGSTKLEELKDLPDMVGGC